MIKIGDFKADPLNGNPYSIIANKALLETIYPVMTTSSTNAPIGATVVPTNSSFRQLSDTEWSQLKTFGLLKVNPILFSSGTANLTVDGKSTVDQAAGTFVQNYPQYRVLIKGHTAPSADTSKEAENGNTQLSQERADSVRDYLVKNFGIDSNRLKAKGMGSSELLSRNPGEGESSYRGRLPRVEFILMEDKK
jgi:outer membrane protein OmpA-like peptidoglycan-associated protein